MTQPEDDAARLARDIATAVWKATVLHHDVIPHVAYRIAPIIRAHLAERDARERMVREATTNAGVSLLEAEDFLMQGVYRESPGEQELRHRVLTDLRKNLESLRAALSAKSDEQ